MNNNEALTTLVVGGRTAKEYSQRELARRVGISNSSLNDIENGRVAKPDPDILKKIAEELNLSLRLSVGFLMMSLKIKQKKI